MSDLINEEQAIEYLKRIGRDMGSAGLSVEVFELERNLTFDEAWLKQGTVTKPEEVKAEIADTKLLLRTYKRYSNMLHGFARSEEAKRVQTKSAT